MIWVPTTDTANMIPEGFLASTADLVGVLVHVADSNKLHSAQHRRDLRAQAALVNLLPNPSTEGRPLEMDAAALQVLDRTRKAATTGEGNIRAGASRSAQPRPRKHCACGECKWCLDNIRWDRIYNEKFAQPAYYDSMIVRHDSSLGELR
jgi:hypothetical protein